MVNGKKRTAAQPFPVRKRSRLSAGAQGLLDIAAAATEFNGIFGDFRDVIAASVATPPTAIPTAATAPAAALSNPVFQTSPQRRVSAVYKAQQEDWMLPLDRLELIEILQDLRKADTYMALLTDEMRIPWVIKELAKVGVPVFHPTYSAGPLSALLG